MAATNRLNGTTEAPAPRPVPVPTAAHGNVAELCAALYQLTQSGTAPPWIQGAGRELCRDFGVTMVAVG